MGRRLPRKPHRRLKSFTRFPYPAEAAILYFAIVDAALKVLIEREKWNGFEEKDTCARVIIDDCLHVDVPLYAIPDDQFGRLTKAATDRAIADSEDNIDFMSSRKMRIESWDQVDSDKVLLAHRKEELEAIRSAKYSRLVSQCYRLLWRTLAARMPVPEGLARSSQA